MNSGSGSTQRRTRLRRQANVIPEQDVWRQPSLVVSSWEIDKDPVLYGIGIGFSKAPGATYLGPVTSNITEALYLDAYI